MLAWLLAGVACCLRLSFCPVHTVEASEYLVRIMSGCTQNSHTPCSMGCMSRLELGRLPDWRGSKMPEAVCHILNTYAPLTPLSSATTRPPKEALMAVPGNGCMESRAS